MTSTLRRATGFALVGSLSLAVPFTGRVEEPALATVAAAGPFLLVGAIALGVKPDSIVFELFARPGDRRDGTLYGLAGFALAAAGLAILAVQFGLPSQVYVAAVVLLAWGNLGGMLVRTRRPEPVLATGGFVLVGFLAALLGQIAVAEPVGSSDAVEVFAFIAASGALLAALLREALFQRDDPLVMVTVALLLWLFASLEVTASSTRIGVALAATAALGLLSFRLETASLPGMLTGVLLALLTLVLGDYGWFAMLVAFFGIGGLSTKYAYDDKLARGIAEPNEGARGTGNVLANSLVALLAVLAAAASQDLALSRELFLFAFAGSLAAALADTLSSEIGGLYDRPRMITTFRVAEPGTDGAVTWQGEVAGVVGSGVVALLGVGLVASVGASGSLVILLAGLVGMTVDSLLGALLEGWLLGNQGVNLLATLSAAVFAAALATALGIVPV
ncbi:MAG: DUF92 domain-containing protein [Haloarculaceae archaeon]